VLRRVGRSSPGGCRLADSDGFRRHRTPPNILRSSAPSPCVPPAQPLLALPRRFGVGRLALPGWHFICHGQPAAAPCACLISSCPSPVAPRRRKRPENGVKSDRRGRGEGSWETTALAEVDRTSAPNRVFQGEVAKTRRHSSGRQCTTHSRRLDFLGRKTSLWRFR
jgi:hypothetical protein